MNRLSTTVEVLGIQAENLMTAESRISDVDAATEMAAMTRNQVLAQAGVAMLAQANTMPSMALSLLR
jgi:flagellin